MPRIDRPDALAPAWQTSDGSTVRLYAGDAAVVCDRLPAESVHQVVTSPPYWNLRDYGHAGQIGAEPSPDCNTRGQAQCGRCFVCSMVRVSRSIHRVLRDDGTFWLNLGDSYGGSGGGSSPKSTLTGGGGRYRSGSKNEAMFNQGKKSSGKSDLPRGNLIGIPWRVALALQADGWVLRQEVIWAKPSPMPESVKNRCTRSHEQLFLLTKSEDYFYDWVAIAESAAVRNHAMSRVKKVKENEDRGDGGRSNVANDRIDSNKRDVWWVASDGYEGAHFATFPPRLIEPAIRAGTSLYGCCSTCGSPWKRVTTEERVSRPRPRDYVKRTGEEGTGNSCPNSAAGVKVVTLGWEPSCDCGAGIVPCTVLDPFVGSGTTCCVAAGLGRRSIGIEVSHQTLHGCAVPRIEGELMSRPALAGLIGREPPGLRW